MMMKKQLMSFFIALAFVVFLVFTGICEDVAVEINPYDKQIYWKYLCDTPDGTRVFLNDARFLSFRFVNGQKESIFKVRNPSFLIHGDFPGSCRYAIIDHELFVTYRIISSEGVDKIHRSYVYSIKGLDKITTPTIQSLGMFHRDKAWFHQVARIGNYFVALLDDFKDETKKIEVYDNYKRLISQYPVLSTTPSIYYSQSKNNLYFVNPQSQLTEVSMNTFNSTVFSFEDNVPEIKVKELHPPLPMLRIFAKDEAMNYLYYAVPNKDGEQHETLLLEANILTKKTRFVAALEDTRVVDVRLFNDRYIVVRYFGKSERGNIWELFDTIDKEYIPLKGRFCVAPQWSITLERPPSTPYQSEKISDEEYKFKFFDNFTFDDNSISQIKK